MNATVTSDSISSILLNAPFQVNIWFGTFILIMGDFGSIGNIIVFRSRPFRTRACSVYLMWDAVINLFRFNFPLIERVIENDFQIPITTRYDALCKTRMFATQYTNQLAFFFFMFATIDRLLSAQRSASEYENA
jgi:hypothetical protein